jgi:hypothetical protein
VSASVPAAVAAAGTPAHRRAGVERTGGSVAFPEVAGVERRRDLRVEGDEGPRTVEHAENAGEARPAGRRPAP